MAAENFQRKSLDTPDESRTFEHGNVAVVALGGLTVSSLVLHPGWRWSENVNPTARTGSPQVLYTGYPFLGRLRVGMYDGTEQEFGPGDAYVNPPGHGSWVVGDEPVVQIDMSSHTAPHHTSRSDIYHFDQS